MPTFMPAFKLRQVALLWAGALALSALLAGCGQRWPQPLPIRADVALVLVVLPPLALVFRLLARWRLPVAGGEGESLRGTESLPPEQERQ